MRTRRIALITALVVGLIGTTAGVAVAKRAPEGFRNVNVKDAGFKVAIPDDWEVLNLTREDVEDAFENLEENAPNIAEAFPGGIADLFAQNVVLYAATEGDEVNPNMNVIFSEGEGLPSTDEVESQLLTIVDEVKVREVRVDGQDAIRAVYDLDLGTAVVHGVQYQIASDDGLLGFTFTTSVDDPMTSTVKKMAKSIDLA